MVSQRQISGQYFGSKGEAVRFARSLLDQKEPPASITITRRVLSGESSVATATTELWVVTETRTSSEGQPTT